MYLLKNPGFSIIIPILSAKSISFPISFSPTTTLPPVGFKYPIIVLNRTVLPEPFLPIIPYIFPFSKLMLIRLSATTSPNLFVTFSTRIASAIFANLPFFKYNLFLFSNIPIRQQNWLPAKQLPLQLSLRPESRLFHISCFADTSPTFHTLHGKLRKSGSQS